MSYTKIVAIVVVLIILLLVVAYVVSPFNRHTGYKDDCGSGCNIGVGSNQKTESDCSKQCLATKNCNGYLYSDKLVNGSNCWSKKLPSWPAMIQSSDYTLGLKRS